MTLNPRSPLTPLRALSAATATGLLVYAAQQMRHRHQFHWVSSAGCGRTTGFYPDKPVVVPMADGSHQGPCLAMLREDRDPDAANIAPFNVDYDEALRSCTEVALNLALNFAEAEFAGPCDCGDEDCDSGDVEIETLHLVAGRKMLLFAKTFEDVSAHHNRRCRACRRAGTRSTVALSAQFCRDLADDLLTNFEADDIVLRGVPIHAAMEVIEAMIDFGTSAHDVDADEQINGLATNLCRAIAHAEGHDAAA